MYATISDPSELVKTYIVFLQDAFKLQVFYSAIHTRVLWLVQAWVDVRDITFLK
jgi:hypothetical protein